MTYTPGQLKRRAMEKPGIRPSAGKNYDKRILSDEVEKQLSQCALKADEHKDQWTIATAQLFVASLLTENQAVPKKRSEKASDYEMDKTNGKGKRARYG